MKLTKPQLELLNDATQGNGHTVEHYRPAQKLVALGLCEWRHDGVGGSWLNVTDAGRAALKAARDGA